MPFSILLKMKIWFFKKASVSLISLICCHPVDLCIYIYFEITIDSQKIFLKKVTSFSLTVTSYETIGQNQNQETDTGTSYKSHFRSLHALIFVYVYVCVQ